MSWRTADSAVCWIANMYRWTVGRPNSLIKALMSVIPRTLAAIWAFKSEMLSDSLRVPEQPSYRAGSSTRSRTTSSSLNLPAETSFVDSIAAPSCHRALEVGGMEPAVAPPISAW